jgi:hypothetical protein
MVLLHLYLDRLNVNKMNEKKKPAVHVNVGTQFIIKDLLPCCEAFITVLRGYI